MRPSVGATAPKRPFGVQCLAVGLGRAAAAEQAGAGELLDADGEAHVALARLDRHDRRAQRGGAGGARVGHVVDGDAGLADLLLQLLADAGARPSGCRRRARRCRASSRRRRRARPSPPRPRGRRCPCRGACRTWSSLIPRIQMSSLAMVVLLHRCVAVLSQVRRARSRSRWPRRRRRRCRASRWSRRTFMPSVTCSGSGSTLIEVAAHARAVAVDHAGHERHRHAGRGEA